MLKLEKIEYIISLALLLLFNLESRSQVVLDANDPGDTYELINSVFAPGYDVTETPDCAHPEFGRHIDEVMDKDLGINVFRFHIHVTPDNDRCINFDRQRNEIKTYDKSPNNLKAVEGETVVYKWKFKLDSAFQPSTSFTHIHQLKAVGGSEESMPLITLSLRKSSTNSLQIRYAKNTTQTTIKQVALSPFLGEWIEVSEKVLFGEEGIYEIQIKRVIDGETLLEYSNSSIRMWKTGASFIRPKWGIYRSLNVPFDIRDEVVMFANFSVTEEERTAVKKIHQKEPILNVFPNPAIEYVNINYSLTEAENIKITINGLDGKTLKTLVSEKKSVGIYQINVDVSDLAVGLYFIELSTKGYNKSFKLSISR